MNPRLLQRDTIFCITPGSSLPNGPPCPKGTVVSFSCDILGTRTAIGKKAGGALTWRTVGSIPGTKEEPLSVLTEERLIQFLKETIEIEKDCLDRLVAEGTQPVAADILARYRSLIQSIHAEKDHEPSLQDECWGWIWEIKEGMNLIQLYGRLAWLNLQLLELL